MVWARFLSAAQSKLRLCSANHRPIYWCNWAQSELTPSKRQKTGPSFWCGLSITSLCTDFLIMHHKELPVFLSCHCQEIISKPCWHKLFLLTPLNYAVHPKKFAYASSFVAFYHCLVAVCFTHILQDNLITPLAQGELLDGPSFSMMMSSNGNIFRVTGHLCGEFTGPWWIPRTKASDTALWCFLSSASE